MRLHLFALVAVLFGLTAATSSVNGQVLITLTNQVWRYDTAGLAIANFQDPAFDDSAWPEGHALFGFENSAAAALTANVYPYTNTYIAPQASGGPTLTHFRTHFTFNLGSPNNYALTVSNIIDDGYIMYLNGVEVDRFNMNATSDAAQAANPNGEGNYVTRPLNIPAGTLINGDNVLAVAVYQNGTASSDILWGTWLHAKLGYRPRILSPTAQVNINVEQFRGTNLVVNVDAAPPASLQWYFDADKGGPNPATPITGANATNYTISNMDLAQQGNYFLQASNILGTSNSPIFNVTYIQDTTAPLLVTAIGDPSNPTTLTVRFSEDVVGATIDNFFYYLQDVNDPGNVVSVDAVAYGASSNSVILTLTPPGIDPAFTYDLVVSVFAPQITDLAGNQLADPSTVRVTLPAVFEDGVNGYAGTEDTEVRFSLPDSAAGGAQTTVNCDQQDGTPAGEVHALIRFNNVIGGGAGQVPLGASIINASLRIYTDDQGSSPARVMRMLVPWDETSTWNTMTNGVDLATEAVQINTVNSSDEGTPRFFDDIDVTSTVQDWANGQVNYGFGFLPVGTDGWRWVTSENTGDRPRLTVAFAVTPTACNIQTQPVGTNVNEKQAFNLTVVSRGSDLTYQWFKNNVVIPGATGASYSVARAIPADSGTYKVVIHNNIGPDCTSANAVVNVTPDTVRPALTSALGNADQTTISLSFNDTLEAATAGNPANYTLNGGLTIVGVALNGSSVTLTSSAPRVVGNNYTLNITGVRDDAVAHNVINPNPTSTNLFQQFRVMPFNQTWKFDTNGLDLFPGWTAPSYNDSAWPSGTALLGLETTAATLTTLAAQGLNTNNAMSWSLLRPDGTTNITWYLRTTVNIPYSLSGATVTLRDVIDDGSVYYFNGVEVQRFNMPAGADGYLVEAVNAPGEGVIRSSTLTNISCGPNAIAVSLHNDSPTSSDILFAAELLVTVPSFSACTGASALTIVNNGNGTVTLSWTGSGTLQESTNLSTWTNSANQANPQTFAPVGKKFYRVQ